MAQFLWWKVSYLRARENIWTLDIYHRIMNKKEICVARVGEACWELSAMITLTLVVFTVQNLLSVTPWHSHTFSSHVCTPEQYKVSTCFKLRERLLCHIYFTIHDIFSLGKELQPHGFCCCTGQIAGGTNPRSVLPAHLLQLGACLFTALTNFVVVCIGISTPVHTCKLSLGTSLNTQVMGYKI